MNLLIIGAPGAGKGTMSDLLIWMIIISFMYLLVIC